MRPPSYYFGFRERVDRESYLRTGLVLMALKYAIDAFALYSVQGVVWTPVDYLLPLVSLSATKTSMVGTTLPAFLITWTLPFLWIAVSMTMRRAVDAGKSPWTALWIFVPVLNYVAMLRMALLPSDRSITWDEEFLAKPTMAGWRSALGGTFVGVAFGLVAVLGLALSNRTYSLALFLAVPFVIGVLVAFLYNRPSEKPFRTTLKVVAVSLLATGGAILLFALEGLICLIMAFPIAIVLASLGAAAGRAAATLTKLTPSGAALSILVIPATLLVDDNPPQQRVYEVVSAVEINAPADVVWNHVVAFSPITSPPGLLFRLGVAYPVRATIEGSGVGALRLCEFSTGAFVEPITVWDRPRRLAFDVVEQPPPMRELSPYGSISPPHLDGFFQAVRGEFRLVPLAGGRTRLEGSTWYTLDIYPRIYWGAITEKIVSSIHKRVLEHIATEAESRSLDLEPPPGALERLIE